MISKEEIKKIAKLARLELTDKEIIKMQKDLSEILNYFDLLKKVTGKSKGVSSAREQGFLRKDKFLSQPEKVLQELIKAAPNKKENYVKVKAIL